MPTSAACSRVRRIRASGANVFPLTMPIASSWPRISGSAASAGSSWTSPLTISKKPKSDEGIVLNATPLPSTKVVSCGGTGAPGRTLPPSSVATLVPCPPGTYEYSLRVLLMRSTVGPGALPGFSLMNERPSMRARVVREWATWNPLSGSAPA